MTLIVFGYSVFAQEVLRDTLWGMSYNGKIISKRSYEKGEYKTDLEYYKLINGEVTHLTVLGEITDNVIYFMRDNLPNLVYLDLSKAFIVPSEIVAIKESAFRIKLHYPDEIKYNIIPINAFCEPNGIGYRSHKKLQRVILPESLDAIGENAFRDTKIDTIVIPPRVRIIATDAFKGCDSLRYISFKNLRYIELSPKVTVNEGAFSGCVSLSQIKIPENAEVIVADYAFVQCVSLKNILNSNRMISIGCGAFRNCKNLDSFAISNYIHQIKERTFGDCKSLQCIIFPDSLQSIAWSAFENCTGLTNIKLPEKLKKIEERAFAGCSGLISVELSDSLKVINAGVFSDCINLVDIKWPKELKEIRGGAFFNCSGLSSVILPNNIQKIGVDAFANCTSLTQINLPDSLEYIGTFVFKGCSSLKNLKLPQRLKEFSVKSGIILLSPYGYITDNADLSISVDERIPFFSIKDGVLFNKEKTNLLGCLTDMKGEYKVPASVKTISMYAFMNMKDLTSVIMSNVDSIGEEAFAHTSLESVSMNKSIKAIGAFAFAYSDITSIAIPDSLKTIQIGTFNDCINLASVDIPQGVKRIESSFQDCKNLKKISVYWTEPQSVYVDGCAFRKCGAEEKYIGQCILEVPLCTKEKYLELKPWKEFQIVERTQNYNK